jgi:hypothetical protein
MIWSLHPANNPGISVPSFQFFARSPLPSVGHGVAEHRA